MRIFLMGSTSSRLGGMEFHNLGNYAIMEPLIIYLKREFPEAEISTSIQMSDAFCQRFSIEPKRKKRFWTYTFLTAVTTPIDILKLWIWLFFKNVFRLDLQFILKSSALLDELNKADLVVDFSGDRFGDNPFVSIFLEDWAEILMAKKLGKPVVMFAGSPGPFDKFSRKPLAKYALNRVDLITNREPVSTELLKDMGVRPEIIKSMACPAFLFGPRRRDDIADVLEREGIISENKKPLVGIILCGWSMPKPPYYKVPREKEELMPFAELVRHLIKNLGVRVMLMSHQNNTDKQMNLIPANDYVIVHQLYDILKRENYGDDLFVLDGLYDAPTSKAIIGCFDMLISGRIHGAVGGLSQEIPTVIINYGNGPRPHKLKGFAKLTGMEEYVCDPTDAQDMIEKAGYVWKNREAVRGHLKERIPQVKELAKANFKLLREFV